MRAEFACLLPRWEASLGGVPMDRARLTRLVRRDFELKRDLYSRFAQKIIPILENAIQDDGIKVHLIDYRTKSVKSFIADVHKETQHIKTAAEFRRAVNRLTDRAGLRVITYLPSDICGVGRIVEKEFSVIKKVDMGAESPSVLGYRSLHYDIRFRKARVRLSDYRAFKGMTAEIQVRTILQHAWAEIEHDIVYKARMRASKVTRRQFATLSGLLEVADREFQSVHDALRNGD